MSLFEESSTHLDKQPTDGQCPRTTVPTGTIFELVKDIIGTNLLTKFHEHPTINVASTVLTKQTCFHYIHIEKTAPTPGGHVFPLIWTIFKLNRHIQKTHVLPRFHKDWTTNTTSRVFTCFHYIHIEKTVPPTSGHVFSPIWTIFELVRDINQTNVLTKCYDDWAKIVYCPPPGGHVFQLTGIIFELHQHLHEDWASNGTSTMFTSFKFSRGINGTNVLTKFHEDQTINMASRVFTRQNIDDGRR
ncbi:hypothetical protein DPMN_155632 [Dreissena polymorpha]|uniref:Uncharacterized protein n=1 Tax=Dreissena polymorpha TaxID=45954 RepID=A0A9D4JBJ3_DREPO|nr:hypothetical protein DPMN_155632 [Dreissena polymorpha]